MRLGLIYLNFGRSGGLENYLSEFARRLAGQNHELHIIAAGPIPPDALPPGAQAHPLDLPRLPRSRRLVQFDRRATALAASLDPKLDLTIGFGRTTTHDLHRAGGGCHRVYSRFLPPWKRFSIKNQVELHLERQLYTAGGTRHFVANSDLVRNQLIDAYAVPADRVSVIHTAVDCEHFYPGAGDTSDPDRSALRRELLGLGDGPGRPAFLFASLNHKRKGLDALLDVWPDVDADLCIAGTPLDTHYRSTITRRNLTSNVHSLGRHHDLAPFYRAADFFIHPTLYDACANTVLQAMASGLPAIVSARDGAAGFIEPETNGFILHDPTNRAELLAAIKNTLALTPATRQSLAQRAREKMLPLTWPAHLAAWRHTIARI